LINFKGLARLKSLENLQIAYKMGKIIKIMYNIQMKKIFTYALLVAFAILCPCCSVIESPIYTSSNIDKVQKNIAVGIVIGATSFKVGSPKGFYVSDASNRRLKYMKGNANVCCWQKGIRIEKHRLSSHVKIKPSNDVIFVNSKPYKGCLELIKSGNKINVINILTVEDYVKGVLPREMDSVSIEIIEALKTQAIISRTYAICNLSRHGRQGFNVCASTHCQVYGGLSGGTDATNKAVQETKGKVLTYNGKFAQTLFHANCAGRTDNPKYIWQWNHEEPYLKGVKCGYCYKSPHTKWEQEIDADLISQKLADNNIGKIKKIKIKGKTPSGAAKELEIIHSNGKTVLNAYKFRLAVGAHKIKSHTFDSIQTKGNKIYFKGRGYGHKSGLCQWGAKGMAEKGKTYKKILKYYYPGTKIEAVGYI
jgi:stage II sporulation protein D